MYLRKKTALWGCQFMGSNGQSENIRYTTSLYHGYMTSAVSRHPKAEGSDVALPCKGSQRGGWGGGGGGTDKIAGYWAPLVM